MTALVHSLPYLSLYIFVIAATFFSSTRWVSDAQARNIVVLVVFALGLFIGLRYEVGPDWKGYQVLFESTLKGIFYISGNDPLFLFVNYSVGNLFGPNSFQIVIACLALFFLLPLVFFNFKSSVDVRWLLNFFAVSFPITVILLGTGYLRQGIAATFLPLILDALRKTNWKMSIWLIIIASLFHKSFIIFFILPLIIAGVRSRQKKLFLYMAAGAIITILGVVLLQLFGRFYIGNLVQSNGGLIRIGYLGILSTLAFASKSSLRSKTVWISAAVSLLGITASSLIYSTITDRLLLYIFVIVFAELARKEIHSISYFLAIITSFIYCISWLLLSPWPYKGWFPYKNILF